MLSTYLRDDALCVLAAAADVPHHTLDQVKVHAPGDGHPQVQQWPMYIQRVGNMGGAGGVGRMRQF